MKLKVCRQKELLPGERKVIMKGKIPVIVFCNNDYEYFAIHGVCPHQGALLEGGEQTWLTMSQEQGTYRVERLNEILRCPWHSFDYDLKSGECVTDCKLKVKTYIVQVEDGYIHVDV